MKHLLAAVLVVGCSGTKPEVQTTPEPKPVGDTGSAAVAPPTGPDPACVDATTKLGTWLASLVAEGSNPLMLDRIKLVKLDGEAANSIPAAPVLHIGTTEVTYQGQLLSVVPIKDKGVAIKDALAAVTSTDTVILVDATVPWSAVSIAVNAAAAANRTHITFAFEAGAPGKTPAPPPSAVDKELDELAKPMDPNGPMPKLYDPNDPNRPKTVPDKVFKDCPIDELFPKIGAANSTAEKDKLVVEGLPKTIQACNCKVEIASVQRLLWSWYRRDSSPQTLGIVVDLGKGAVVTAKPAAPWSESSKLVIAAAKAGKPITLK